jgi:uncharacterized protein YjeT (DUF2065 family)
MFMIWFLYGLALFWIAMGALFILYTEESRRVLRNLMEKTKPRFLAFLPMAVGVLLIIAARESGAFWFIVILGILAIGKGLYFLLGPRGQTEALFAWWFKSVQDRTYRFSGLIMVVLGMVILSWV